MTDWERFEHHVSSLAAGGPGTATFHTVQSLLHLAQRVQRLEAGMATVEEQEARLSSDITAAGVDRDELRKHVAALEAEIASQANPSPALQAAADFMGKLADTLEAQAAPAAPAPGTPAPGTPGTPAPTGTPATGTTDPGAAPAAPAGTTSTDTSGVGAAPAGPVTGGSQGV